MTHAISAARWRAVAELQLSRSTAVPHSLKFDAADHAIDLVLSPSRQEGAFLAHNAYKDGRSVVIRRRRRDASRNTALYRNDDTASLEIAVETERRVDQTYAQSLPQALEQRFLWLEAYRKLRAAGVVLNPLAGRVLDGWRDGEAVAETARAMGISTAYVKKLRQLLRAAALSAAAQGGSA